MKKIISLLLIAVIVLGLCACGVKEGASGKEGLQVGFGRKSILPDQQGVQIAGGDATSRLSEGYLDELTITCIAITEGEQTVLLYTADLITVDANVYAAQASIADATGIPAENILLNTTHNHSGVSIRSSWNGVEAYKSKFYQAAADAGVAAIADQSSAEVYYGSVQTENIVFVRHYLKTDGTTYGNGHGSMSTANDLKEHLYPADEELQVIKFARAAEDKKDVVLMNLGAHATIVNTASEKSLSADWPGAARAYVESNSDSLCAVFEAAAGDQAPTSKIPGLGKYSNKQPECGQKIGEYCVSVLSSEMTKAEGTGINLVMQDYTGKSMKEGTEDSDLVKKANEVSAIAKQYGTSHANATSLASKYGFDGVLAATALSSRVNYPETYTMELHAMTVHGVSFIFAPYEMFGASGRYIKDNSPYDMTFVVTCSENSKGYHMGYLPTEYGCEEGFYEYDVTKFARGTAEDLAKTYVDILTGIKNS